MRVYHLELTTYPERVRLQKVVVPGRFILSKLGDGVLGYAIYEIDRNSEKIDDYVSRISGQLMNGEWNLLGSVTAMNFDEHSFDWLDRKERLGDPTWFYDLALNIFDDIKMEKRGLRV